MLYGVPTSRVSTGQIKSGNMNYVGIVGINLEVKGVNYFYIDVENFQFAYLTHSVVTGPSDCRGSSLSGKVVTGGRPNLIDII